MSFKKEKVRIIGFKFKKNFFAINISQEVVAKHIRELFVLILPGEPSHSLQAQLGEK
jgi:hypothetical protein